ncbi:MAG TPA: MarR family winged helix-turn-helix transcriptional regulator [Candidatus Dormibacteraeota bacterium]|jgi:DNA-binding MarR family transcriptional regulator|nr:MarR family winged helix-turn-helix transcriptional regulator [Candidatus Dormibacteraeota bacterium]
MPRRADVSLLFDLFVVSQRVRRVLADGMAGAGMRADEYAVYSLLFMHGPMTATEMAAQLALPLSTTLDYVKALDASGHLHRIPHPDDGRAVQLALNARGVAAQARANQDWEVVRKQVEGSLRLPKAEVRAALQALDDAAAAALTARRKRSPSGLQSLRRRIAK